MKTLAASAKNSDSYVTTMFDFYGLPMDMPGVADAKRMNNPYEKVELIENEIQKAEGYAEKCRHFSEWMKRMEERI